MAFDRAWFQGALTTNEVGAALRYEPVVTSTMDVARDAGRAGAAHGLVVLADEQTAGRGRFGRRWVAPAGVNLTFTILVRPALPVLERLSMIAALAVGDGVAEATGLRPVFKWPNDVLLNGRKLAGVLIEAEFSGERPTFALVGIGLNVNQRTADAPEIAEIAVSLRDHLGHDVPREPLLAAVLGSFERWYRAAPDAAVQASWAARLVTLGQDVRVTFAGQAESGRAESVTETGALCLRRADGSLVVLPAGEVTMRVPAPTPNPSPNAG